MTQQPVSAHDAALEKAWERIGHDRWDQMTWFVKLANIDLAALSPGDVQNLQDECQAIRMVAISFHSIPSNRKRYPFLRGWNSSLSPTVRDLENIHAAIAPHLNNLADGMEVSLGPVQVAHTTRFRKTTENERKGGYPPHVIYPTAILKAGSHSWPDEFLLRTARLLEEFVDGIRRCPHCKKVFLQLRRNATYCGRACHSVAGMRRIRTKQAFEKQVKTQGRKTTRKGRSPHGKKRR